MADALDAEDRTRERISQLLHDEVLQSLLSRPPGPGQAEAHREVGETMPPRSAREAIVSAIRELRNAVIALHPVTLEQGGLASAIEAIADLHASAAASR